MFPINTATGRLLGVPPAGGRGVGVGQVTLQLLPHPTPAAVQTGFARKPMVRGSCCSSATSLPYISVKGCFCGECLHCWPYCIWQLLQLHQATAGSSGPTMVRVMTASRAAATWPRLMTLTVMCCAAVLAVPLYYGLGAVPSTGFQGALHWSCFVQWCGRVPSTCCPCLAPAA